MIIRSFRIPPVLAIAAIGSGVLLSACGQTAKPSPIDAALNAPEGSTPQAPREPAPLLPPPMPPDPGRNMRPFR